jgi:hypothetical protein
MSRGKLCCCGSPNYLKSKYGSGYNLVLTRKPTENHVISPSLGYLKSDDQSSTSHITEFIQKHIATAQLNTSINNEVSYILPKDMCDRFSQLFIDLEASRDSLNIVNIGISVTTVEEVFLKIGELENCDDPNSSSVHLTKKPSVMHPNESFAASTVNLIGENNESDDQTAGKKYTDRPCIASTEPSSILTKLYGSVPNKKTARIKLKSDIFHGPVSKTIHLIFSHICSIQL